MRTIRSTSHRPCAMRGQFLLFFRMGQDVFQRVPNGLVIHGVNQHAVFAIFKNVPRAAIMGGHHRQPSGSGFQKSEAKGFSECRVYKHAFSLGGPTIKLRYFRCSVCFGHSAVPAQVIVVYQF